MLAPTQSSNVASSGSSDEDKSAVPGHKKAFLQNPLNTLPTTKEIREVPRIR
jgi:hypothetical protein